MVNHKNNIVLNLIFNIKCIKWLMNIYLFSDINIQQFGKLL